MRLQQLVEKDYLEIIKLWEVSGLPYKPRGRDSKQAVADQMQKTPEFFLGAFQEEKLVGTVIGSIDFRGKGWINRLAVHPDYRRLGVARTLIEEMEKILKKKGAVLVCALIEGENKAPLLLFEKLGFVVHNSIIYVSKRDRQEY